MDKVLILENETQIQESFKNLFDDLDINLELIHCYNINEYNETVNSSTLKNEIKSMIFDLANTMDEESSKKFEVVDFIRHEYQESRIPIFIHSGFLDSYQDFESQGTIFRIPKTATSIIEISEKIKLFKEVGFLDIFSKNGSLESKIIKDLHNAFVSQFKNNEIEEIINSINNTKDKDVGKRVYEVFERVALRAFSENNTRSLISENGTIDEMTINSIEHYFRRSSSIDFWTGDIFKHKVNNDHLVVLTPRCNISNGNYERILLCYLNEFTEDNINAFKSKKGIDNFRRNIVDDVQKTGDRYRFLPRTPQFKGGYIDFNKHFTISPKTLTDDFDRVISLSEELTNDIMRKFTSYLLRFGISNTDIFESFYYMNDNPEVS